MKKKFEKKSDKKRSLFKRVLFFIVLTGIITLIFILGFAVHWYYTYSYTTTAYNDLLQEQIQSRFNQEVSLKEVTISPREGMEIHDFTITNKLGFTEEYFLEAPKLQIPFHFGSLLRSLARRELILDRVYLLEPKIYIEITSEEGINFPQTFPDHLLKPVTLTIQNNIPVFTQIEQMIISRPVVYFTYLDTHYGTIYFQEVTANVLDEQIVNIQFEGESCEFEMIHSKNFSGIANLILQETPIGTGQMSLKDVLFEELPFAEQFETFFGLPPVRRQIFSKMKCNFNLSDRTLLLSDFSGESRTMQFKISGNINFDGSIDLIARYSYPAPLPGTNDQTFTISVSGDLIDQEYSY